MGPKTIAGEIAEISNGGYAGGPGGVFDESWHNRKVFREMPGMVQPIMTPR